MAFNNKTCLRYHFLLTSGLLLAAGSASAQQPATTFTVHGRVLDLQDKPVAGAIIRLAEAHQLGVSDSLGNFTIDYMRPGTYEVVVVGDDFDSIEGRMNIEPDNLLLAHVETRLNEESNRFALDRLKQRRDRSSLRVMVWDRARLGGEVGSFNDLLLASGTRLGQCGRFGDLECAIGTAGVRVMNIYIDEVIQAPISLARLQPRDFAYAEFYPELGMLRLYSARFMRKLPSQKSDLELIR